MERDTGDPIYHTDSQALSLHTSFPRARQATGQNKGREAEGLNLVTCTSQATFLVL